MSERQFREITGQVLHPVDYLVVNIDSDVSIDKGYLRPFSLQSSARRLKMYYQPGTNDVDRVAEVLNRTVPPNRADDSTELTVRFPERTQHLKKKKS
ncbi:uncharacterized protein LOC135226508 [Macrobrachium nipponense]|uniref:uncharacterized protein LOC135226508 n=1 Tax=Macrobrachium nipponense TaxID=159736 RepID=UPI0030C7F82A